MVASYSGWYVKYFSMFSGIGGFELGIQNASIKSEELQRQDLRSREVSNSNKPTIRKQRHTCVGYSEIDKYAIKVYERNFNGHTNYGDATTIKSDELPDFDLLVGGFPCQSFSVAGKRGGFNDTRGTLFFDIARILKHKRPRHLLLENVKGLLSHDSGKTFQTMLGVLADLGYRVEWQVLNSKDFGVPQNRERVFIVGHIRGECGHQVFPISATNGKTIEQLNQPTHSNDRIYADDGISPTLNTAQGGNRQPFVVPAQWRRTEKGKAFRRVAQAKGRDLTPFSDGHRELVPKASDTIGAITSQAIAKDSLLFENAKIRRLTPKECERLQGFPDDWTKWGYEVGKYMSNGKSVATVSELISDSQRYKMCGNAVTVNVIETIMEKFDCLTKPTAKLKS